MTQTEKSNQMGKLIKMQECFSDLLKKPASVSSSKQRAWKGGGSDDRGIGRPSLTRLGIVEKRDQKWRDVMAFLMGMFGKLKSYQF